MLDEPRLLLLRALDPLYPREPPPKASRFWPPLRDRSRLPMRSGPPPRLLFPVPAARFPTLPPPEAPALFPPKFPARVPPRPIC